MLQIRKPLRNRSSKSCASGLKTIDDCTRYKVMEIYQARMAANTILFLEKMVEEMSFPVQSIQTDGGREFFAYKVQEWLREYCIKFHPIRPRRPHLNGKVERTRQTDLKEFWALVDFSEDHLGDQLAYYQHYYNWDRVHGSPGKTSMDKVVELSRQSPFWDEVEDGYDSSKEFIRVHDYKKDVTLLKLKRYL